MSMFGKMSVGVRRIASGVAIRMSSARTTKVYGRSSARRTIHMVGRFSLDAYLAAEVEPPGNCHYVFDLDLIIHGRRRRRQVLDRPAPIWSLFVTNLSCCR